MMVTLEEIMRVQGRVGGVPSEEAGLSEEVRRLGLTPTLRAALNRIPIALL